jgi:hypothetical protein
MLALPLYSLLGLASNSSTVYIIRHGEKKWALGCLSDQGEARAHALPEIFNGRASPRHATFATPDALFANHYDDPIDCERCKQTLEPISANLSLPIIFNYSFNPKLGGNQAAADAILQRAQQAASILVAWEHINIQYLAADLGVDRSLIPSWKDDDYDTVYVLTFVGGGAPFFRVAHENFTTISDAPHRTAPTTSTPARKVPAITSTPRVDVTLGIKV